MLTQGKIIVCTANVFGFYAAIETYVRIQFLLITVMARFLYQLDIISKKEPALAKVQIQNTPMEGVNGMHQLGN